MDVHEKFAESLIRFRKAHGYSQSAMADLMNESGAEGIHQTTISRWEKLTQPPRLDEAVLVARVLGVSLPEMLWDSDGATARMDVKRKIDNVRREVDSTASVLTARLDAIEQSLG